MYLEKQIYFEKHDDGMDRYSTFEMRRIYHVNLSSERKMTWTSEMFILGITKALILYQRGV